MRLDNYEPLLTGKMDKTMVMFRMLEHPTEYTKEQWQEIASDPVCNELYATLSMTAGALASQQASDALTEDDIDAEWARLKNKQPEAKIISWSGRNVAAVISGVIILSGIAWAASLQSLQRVDDCPSSSPSKGGMTAPLQSPKKGDDCPATVTFDNVPIVQVISDLTTFYANHDGIRYEAIYDNDDVRNIRLFYRWDNSLSLQQVVDKLDHFEMLEVRLEGQKIYIEQALSD